MGRKLGDGGANLGEAGSQHNVARAEAYLRTKWHLYPSSRLAAIDMGRKLGVLLYFFFLGGEWVPNPI